MPTWRGRGCKWAVFSYRIESSSLTFTFSLADLKIRGNLCNMSGQIKRDVLNGIYFCMTNRKKARFYIICLILITIKCLSDSFSINDWELSWFFWTQKSLHLSVTSPNQREKVVSHCLGWERSLPFFVYYELGLLGFLRGLKVSAWYLLKHWFFVIN